MIKIWVDDERPMPEGYDYCATSVFDAIRVITEAMREAREGGYEAECSVGAILLDLDHDSGYGLGGDFIEILKYYSLPDFRWSFGTKETRGYNPPLYVRFHSANPVGVKNMRVIVESCPWMEEIE